MSIILTRPRGNRDDKEGHQIQQSLITTFITLFYCKGNSLNCNLSAVEP